MINQLTLFTMGGGKTSLAAGFTVLEGGDVA